MWDKKCVRDCLYACDLENVFYGYGSNRNPEEHIQEFAVGFRRNAFDEKVCKNRYEKLWQIFAAPEKRQVAGEEKKKRWVVELPDTDCESQKCEVKQGVIFFVRVWEQMMSSEQEDRDNNEHYSEKEAVYVFKKNCEKNLRRIAEKDFFIISCAGRNYGFRFNT